MPKAVRIATLFCAALPTKANGWRRPNRFGFGRSIQRLALLGHALWGIGTALVGLLWLYTLLSIVRGRFFVRG